MRAGGGRLAMPKLPGVNHRRAIMALQKAGFRIEHQGKHVKMVKGGVVVLIPRHNPIDAFTMGAIVGQAGLTIDEFRSLL